MAVNLHVAYIASRQHFMPIYGIIIIISLRK